MKCVSEDVCLGCAFSKMALFFRALCVRLCENTKRRLQHLPGFISRGSYFKMLQFLCSRACAVVLACVCVCVCVLTGGYLEFQTDILIFTFSKPPLKARLKVGTSFEG